MNTVELQKTIDCFLVRGKGILAADESLGTIEKRFSAIGLESTEETRKAFRDLLFTAPDLERYIGGVILFEDTMGLRSSSGAMFPDLLTEKGIVPGVKVDRGLVPLENSDGEMTTQGLDGLHERLFFSYKKQGARFAKFRVVFKITENTPSDLLIKTNADILARYAAICQVNDMVPIVEPEVLMDGDHDIEKTAFVTEKVLKHVFEALYWRKVVLEYIILKPNMVVAGKDCPNKPSVEQTAQATLTVLQRAVPAAVPSINFLSGGQSDEMATEHLKAINKIETPCPWYLSFSYGRALQASALKVWMGKEENVKAAQNKLIERAKENSMATL